MFRPITILALAPLALQAAPASARQSSGQTLPPLDYSLPPGQNATQPAPPPVVVPPVIATPTPRPTPTATPRPRPSASPSPRATPRPRPTPVPDATATSEPVPTAEVEPTPEAKAMPAPVQVPEPQATTPAAPAEAPSLFSWPRLLLSLGPLATLLLLVRWILKQRKRKRPVVEDDAPVFEPAADVEVAPEPAPPPVPAVQPVRFLGRPAPVPEPAPAPSLASPAPAIPAGTITAFRNAPKPAADPGYITAFRSPPVPAPTLDIELHPIRAGLNDEAGFVEFQFAMINPSDVAVGDMLVSAWILSASPDQDARILGYLGEPTDPANHNVYALQPGEHREHRATMGVPLDQLHVVEAGGRRFFAPMLLVDARYRSASGAPGRTSAAYMVGRPNATTGRLSPIYVDRGPRAFEGLDARPYPIRAPQA